MVGLCPAPALRSALGSCTSGHVCLTAMLLPLGGSRELRVPQAALFLYKSPFSTHLQIPPAPGALAVGSS